MNYWQIAFNIAQLALTIAVLWNSRNKVTNDRFTQLETSKTKLDLEVKHLKVQLAGHKPVCDNHGRMEGNDKQLFEKIDAVHVAVGKIEGSLGGVKELTTLMNTFLLNQGDKK